MPGVPQRIYPTIQQIDRDSNVNGQRGTFARAGGNQRTPNGGLRCESSSAESSGVNLNSMKRTKQPTDCEAGPSGLGSQPRLDPYPDCQPGPSGLSKQATSSSVSNHETPDNSPSSLSANSPNWDRLKPINRSPSGENRSGGLQLAAFQDQEQAARTCPSRARERQLQALQRFEERMRFNNQARAEEQANSDASSSAKLQRTMVLCVLDISNVLEEECSVRWLGSSEDSFSSGPEETLLYTLVAGRGELIMFGGIHREAMTLMTNSQPSTSSLSNSLHFISAPYGVI